MSCLFNSLSKILHPEKDMRKLICDYMQENKDVLLGLDGNPISKWIEYNALVEKVDDYVSNMRKPGTCGGAFEIAIASKIFNVIIIVHDTRTKELVEFNAANDPKRTINLSWSGGHYEPIL
jgi:hypothetical protein